MFSESDRVRARTRETVSEWEKRNDDFDSPSTYGLLANTRVLFKRSSVCACARAHSPARSLLHIVCMCARATASQWKKCERNERKSAHSHSHTANGHAHMASVRMICGMVCVDSTNFSEPQAYSRKNVHTHGVVVRWCCCVTQYVIKSVGPVWVYELSRAIATIIHCTLIAVSMQFANCERDITYTEMKKKKK